MEHMADGVALMYDRLLIRFIKLDTESDEKEDIEYLTSLTKSAGFMAQTGAAISKSYKQEKRLSHIEERLKGMPINMSMFDDPAEVQAKYR